MNDKPLLLIVDDEDDIRENLCEFAAYKGFEVLEAADGTEALRILDCHTPDLMISDLMMPGMGGMQLLQALLERQCEVPVVIMTAFGTMQYAIDAMKAGAADFLTKPIDLAYMMKVVDRVLQCSAMRQKIKEQQRQLEEDLCHAATIQRCLLPEPLETDCFTLRYRYQPLIHIGGDCLTVYPYNSRRLAVALSDVSGHGVSAALTASLIHNQIQFRLAENQPPAQVIDWLNRFILQNIRRANMFITMVLALIDLDEGILTACNAGHPDLLIWHGRTNTLESIASHTPPIGMLPEILGARNVTTLELAHDDRLLFYSDGFTDSHGPAGDMLGIQGMKEWAVRRHHLPPEDLIDTLFADLAQFRAHEPEDDLTLVVVDIK